MEIYKDDLSWGSHLPALLACVAATDGPVLEVGMGYYSTPNLHSACRGRQLVSIEADAAFASRFDDFEDIVHGRPSGHVIVKRPYDDVLPGFGKTHWSVVFLDESPGDDRGKHLAMIPDADYYVIHDWGAPQIVAGVEPLIPKFKHVKVCKRFTPHTLVLSNFRIPSIP